MIRRRDHLRDLRAGAVRQVRPRLPRDHDELSWYQALFATRLSPNRPSLQELATTAGGFRLATSVGGVLTGRGADLIIIDDPLKPEEAMSESRRAAVNEWFDGTLYSRLNDKAKGAIVIIMQRLHEDDLVGHVLRQEGWEVLSFPAIAESRRETSTSTRRSDPRLSAARPARRCTRSANRWRRSGKSARRSASTISPANISRPPRRPAAAW